MDALPLLVFIWVVGFAITGGMIYELMNADEFRPHFLSTWALFFIIIFLVWPIALGSILITAWNRQK